MNRILFIAALFTLFSYALACYPQTYFQITIGGPADDRAHSIIPVSDGGYLVAGTTHNFAAAPPDLYVIRLDENGDTLWTRTYGGTDAEFCNASMQTSDGSFIIVGTTRSFGLIGDNIYVVKVDSSGNLLWSRTYGFGDDNRALSLLEDPDGNLLLAGFTALTINPFIKDALIIKTNSTGDTLWTKIIGGDEYDILQKIITTSDGNLILAGITQSQDTTGFSPGSDIYVCKLDTTGTLIWSHAFGRDSNVTAFDIGETTDHGFIIAANVDVVGQARDMCLLKIDSSANAEWSRTYGTSGYDLPYSMKLTADSSILLSGTSVIKTDIAGNVQWAKNYGQPGLEILRSVTEAADGSYLFAGEASDSGAGGKDIYIIKSDPGGISGCNENPWNHTSAPFSFNRYVIVNDPWSYPALVTSPPTMVGSGGTVDVLCLIGVSEHQKNNSIFITPNPSSGSFEIHFSRHNQSGEIQCYNSLGILVFSEKINGVPGKKIYLDKFSPGIYFVNVLEGKDRWTERVILLQD